VIVGEAVDLIGDIPPAGEIVERVATEAEALLVGASNRYRVTRRE
jgi:nitronate monooxygenase